MNENIRRSFTAAQEAKSPKAIEPFDLSTLETTRWGNACMSPRWRQLRRMNRGRLIHRNNAKSLIAFGALKTLDNNASTFVSRLKPVASQYSDVEQDVDAAFIRNNEAVPLRRIKPFDDAADLDKAGSAALT
jgi:hypothetical protein